MKNLVTLLKWILVVSVLLGMSNLLQAQTIKAEIFVDTTEWDAYNVQRTGNWKWAQDSSLMWPFDKTARISYEAWCFGVEIYAEGMHHHTYMILGVDGKEDTIRAVRDPRNLKKKLVYRDHHMPYGNHKFTLRGGLFVPRKFVILADSKQWQIPFYAYGDTIPYYDSIPVPVYDTLWAHRDSVTIVERDTLIKYYDTIPTPVYDSIPVYDTIPVFDSIPVPVYDSITVPVYDSIPCPDCPPIDCVDCPPTYEDKIPLWVWFAFGVLVIAVIIFIFTPSRKNNTSI